MTCLPSSYHDYDCWIPGHVVFLVSSKMPLFPDYFCLVIKVWMTCKCSYPSTFVVSTELTLVYHCLSCTGGPKTSCSTQMWSQECWVVGYNHFIWSAGCAAVIAVGHLSFQGPAGPRTFLQISFPAPQCPTCSTVRQSLHLSLNCIRFLLAHSHGLSRCPLMAALPSKYINWSFEFGVVCKIDEQGLIASMSLLKMFETGQAPG